MKKVIITVGLMLGIGLSTQMNAEIKGGIRLDANTSGFILNDMPGVESKLGFGLSVGGYTKIMFNERFGFQPEILLHYKNSKMEMGNIERDFQYFGVELPLYLRVQATDNLFVNVGPYVGVGLDARFKEGPGARPVHEFYKEYGNNDSEWHRWDFGAGLTLGWEFDNGLEVSAGYKIGFINPMREPGNSTMLNQTISLGLAFRF